MESNKKPIRKEYKSGDLTVVWQPAKCIHSTICWKGLPQVFKPKERPWIQLDGCDTEALKKQIETCPSGALSYLNQNKSNKMANSESDNTRVEVIPNGPLAVHSDCSISHPNGTIEQKKTKVFFCRCGASANKPYCDGTHRKVDFEG